MSSTIVAYTIIGSKIDRSKLFTYEERSVHEKCDGAHLAVAGGVYCPACGRPVIDTKEMVTPVEGFEPEGGAFYQGEIDALAVLPVRFGGAVSHFLAVAWSRVSGDGVPERMNPPLVYGRERLRGVLEPLGLWEPENFGIWTALYYS